MGAYEDVVEGICARRLFKVEMRLQRQPGGVSRASSAQVPGFELRFKAAGRGRTGWYEQSTGIEFHMGSAAEVSDAIVCALVHHLQEQLGVRVAVATLGYLELNLLERRGRRRNRGLPDMMEFVVDLDIV